MVVPAAEGIDLFKIAGESISGMSSLRNESELSAHRLWAEGSDKMPSTRYLRPNLQSIYHQPQLCKSMGTIFGNVDLSVAKGLEAVRHKGPSTIGIDTIYRSKGNIPEVFLKGAGVQESFLTLSLASRLRSCRSASRRNRRRATAYTGLILGARRLAP